MLYLAVALHKQLGKEEEALKLFQDAYDHAPTIDSAYKTQLWSRACLSRLYRRLGKVKEAEEQEEMIRCARSTFSYLIHC